MPDNRHIVCPHCAATNRLPAERLEQRPNCGRCKQPLFDGRPVDLDTASALKHLQFNDIPVVLDFWASWCGPCKGFAPVFAQAAGQLEPYYRLAKVNTEAEQSLAAQFGIRSIPTLVIVRHNQELARLSGATDLSNFLRWVRSYSA